jgi:hypothetical protein
MSNWRDAILNDFVPNVSKLTLVADPDSLLTEEKLALELRGRGFDLIEFNDPVEFRYAYESKYRSIWDLGKRTDLVVVLRLQDIELESLPYDLIQAGRKLSFNLGDIFPHMSYPVLETLDRVFLDPLYDAQLKALPDRMGDNATMDFILRHVFGIAAELVFNEVELLRVLLRLHYNKTRIPQTLAGRLVQVLKGNGGLQAWPLEDIVPDEEAFFAFLQERWPVFLSRLSKVDLARESDLEYGLKFSGPAILPFDHQDIRVYIDKLFVEGRLIPVQMVKLPLDIEVRSGIIEDDEVRISRLFEMIGETIPTLESRYSDWTAFASKWAELSALVHSAQGVTFETRLREIGDSLNATFAQWLRVNYAGLLSLPPSNPVMLHHLPRSMARDLEDGKSSRVALLVVDGLALDQWVSIRHILHKQDSSLLMREAAIFAWVPTLTSVSRQSIFSGKPPHLFPSSINSTNSESNLWKQFWEGVGYSRLDISYQRGLGDGDIVGALETTIHPGKTKVVGLVVDKVDKIMHGMQLGAAGMQNQIKQWCRGGYLYSLISYLLNQDFQVWMTSDHGNIECRGKGCPNEGVIAETRGERVRIYPTPELRSQVACSFPFAYEWPSVGLPSGFYPLLAGGHDAFIKEGDITVGHGGCSIEEVIVPLIKFERR